MDIKDLIIKTLQKNGEVRASEIIKISGFSRAYINRFFRELREEGVITIIGKANKAKYISASKNVVFEEKRLINKVCRILKNKNLDEAKVFADIRKNSGIFQDLSDNIFNIFEYAFTEMLNNAIEHSDSDKIEVHVEKKKNNVLFEVRDKGVGIFNNIAEKKHLKNIMEAIQDLLKGKQTTEPASHSGEGVFFTSRVGDILTVESSQKKLIFDNFVEDIFLRDINKKSKGTRIVFSISLDSDKKIDKIFRKYTDDSFVFNKTEVIIELYDRDASYVSRSQARRLLSGLEKFKTIILDFKGIDTVGQGFADEIFRIWRNKYPRKNIITKNVVENVEFMIKRAKDNI